MQTSYILFPLLVLALYAGAETYLMMRPIEGNENLCCSDEMPFFRPLPTTRYYSSSILQLASRLDTIILVVAALFHNFGPFPQSVNLTKRLKVGFGLRITSSIIAALLVNGFTSFSFWGKESPQKYIMDFIYVVTILSLGFRKSKSIGSLIATIGVICVAMIGIGCLATQAHDVSLLDIVFSNIIGMSVGWLAFVSIEYTVDIPIDTTNNNAPRNQPNQSCTCLRDDLSVSSGQERDQQPPSTISTVVQNFHEDFA